MTTSALVGRTADLARIDGLLAAARAGQGGSLVVRGFTGTGKTTLLTEAGRRAREAGMRVLRTSGVEAESGLPFAGLYGLLRPAMDRLDGLPAPQRDAVRTALGLAGGEATERYLVSLAALELLADLAAERPLLVLVDDAPWLDDPTLGALTFLARRVDAEPIAVLISAWLDTDSVLDLAGLPEHRLGHLDERAAEALLDARSPGLAPDVRANVLATAGGNPLALVELPRVAGERSHPTVPLPLPHRLQQEYARRLDVLPATTRAVVLVAAVEEDDTPAVLLRAASLLAGVPVTADDLDPAVEARLVVLDEGALRFSHPLVRSAVRRHASAAEARRAHAALADATAGDTDRRTWHRAATTLGPDDELAVELRELGHRAERRGAPATALAAYERAAQLTTAPKLPAALLLQAVQLAVDLGRTSDAARLLRAADRLESSAAVRAKLDAHSEELFTPLRFDAARVPAFAAIADQQVALGRPDRALDMLAHMASRCYMSNASPEVCGLLVDALDRVPVAAEEPARLYVLALADPVGRGGEVRDLLERLTPNQWTDPRKPFLVGYAALAVAAPRRALTFLTAAAEGMRRAGMLGKLVIALTVEAWAALNAGAPQLGLAAAREALSLGEETGRGRPAAAVLLADRGDVEDAERAVEEAGRAFASAQAPATTLTALARGRIALAGGRPADAFDHLRQLFDPRPAAYHRSQRAGAIAELAEAAAALGGEAADEARRHVAELAGLAHRVPGPHMAAGLAAARAFLAAEPDQLTAADDALAVTGTRFPVLHARLLLLKGARLRRNRYVAESRAALRAARDAFDALTLRPWADRARAELRAAGEQSERPSARAFDALTPQELQIARLAAEGNSNREIGRRLFISHRTVGYHLHRMFPKLGITSRAQLAGIIPELAPT